MTKERFETLVQHLEEYAQRNPAGYRLRVGLLAALGYGYVFLILSLACLLIGGTVFAMQYGTGRGRLLRLGWTLLVLVYLIGRALWVRIPAPEGMALRREEAPQLFSLVDELTARLRAPRPHHILLTQEFNAAIVQRPRLGLLGWQENYLIVGLPLMQALSTEQFRAVLAHEMGHLSGNHGRFASWIYRIRRTWAQLLERMQADKHWSSFLFEPFFRWYAPFFTAYSFVLARAHEYEADRTSAEIAGTEAAATALIATHIKGDFLSHAFWPGVFGQAAHQPEPPAAFAALSRAFQREVPPEIGHRCLSQALAEKTGSGDTHPALADRLAALGYSAISDPVSDTLSPKLGLPAFTTQSAAEQLLGDAQEELTARIDQRWQEQTAPGWRERHTRVQESQKRLAALEEKAGSAPLTEEEAWARARWTHEFHGTDAAFPRFQEVLAQNPDHGPANYALGQILLERNDDAGITHIEKAMQRDPEAVLPGCHTLYSFLRQQGRQEEAERYRERAIHHSELLQRAKQERGDVGPDDTLTPHDLPAAVIEGLREQLARHEQIEAAYLVRKSVTCFPDQPLYVLGLILRKRFGFGVADKSEEVIAKFGSEAEMPGETLCILLDGGYKPMRKIFSRMAGAQVYPT